MNKYNPSKFSTIEKDRNQDKSINNMQSIDIGNKYPSMEMDSGANNRSLLANAGERTLGINSKPSGMTNTANTMERRGRQILIKLTLPRLRKIQALVRGFLVRRKIYPRLYQQFILSKSLLNLIVSNYVYKEASIIIMDQLTDLKYEPSPAKEQARLENYIFDGIV